MKIRVNENNVLVAIIYRDSADTEGIPVKNIPDGVELLKWCYTPERGFYENPNYEPPVVTYELTQLKESKITESKTKLAEWLAANPILYSDGKYYSVTEEKQALLNGNLASYERATKAGIEYPLKWNSTGAECESWDYNDLLVLSLSIAAYVAPKVAKQQTIEIAIKGCESVEEIESIVIDYD